MLLLDLFVMEWILETDELRAGWSIWPSEQSGRTRYVSRFKTVRGEKRGTRNVQDIKYSTSISMQGYRERTHLRPKRRSSPSDNISRSL